MSLSVKRKDCKRQTYWPILSSLETVLTFSFILFPSELHSKHCYKEFINCSYTILCTHICACFYAVLINEGHYLCFCLPLCVPMFELNISSSPPPSPESLPLPPPQVNLWVFCVSAASSEHEFWCAAQALGPLPPLGHTQQITPQMNTHVTDCTLRAEELTALRSANFVN